MYAAIVTSIETKEYSWESNFDRFETILYKKSMSENKNHSEFKAQGDREPRQDTRKRYCREYNRPEGCPKSSPHPAWFGAGQNTVKKTVYHFCATCLIRDRQQKEHPEGHPECPHRS